MSIYIGTTEIIKSGSGLPNTYQEVEYIQSSGTQYMIIGTSFKTSYKTVIDFQMTVTGGDYIPIGINNYDGVNATYRYGIDAYSSYFHVNAGGNWTSTIAEDTNRHTIIIDKNTAIVDGTNYTINYSDYTYSSGIGVFCYNEYNKSSPYTYKSSNKLYKLDIYDENGTHIYDLVPCYRKSDSVIGLYDLVNNQFYTNSGTGTFTKGSDVTAKGIYVGTTPVKSVYVGTTKVRPAGITESGIYHNATDGLISISSDGTNWITITDKNLGATTVYNSGDTLSSANCGSMYQWGNNYGFSSIGTISTTTTTVNTSSYSWQNPYSGSPFVIIYDGNGLDWSTSNNINLWGDSTNTKEARKGPCPVGFHIATKDERGALMTAMTALGISTSQGNKYQQYLKIPFAGYRKYNSGGSVTNQGTWACLWSTTTRINENNTRQAWNLWITSSVADNTDVSTRAAGLNIRPMKNDPVQPDNNRTKLY